MAGPFDYVTPNASVNPFASSLQGFGLGQQLAQQQQNQQLQAQQIQSQLDLQRQYQQDSAALLNNPNAGARDFAAFQLKYPQFKEATKGAFDALSADQQANKVGTAARVYSALNSGRADLATSILDDQIKALENSNADPREINALKGNRQLIEALPLDQARNAAGMFLSTIADPKQFASIAGQLGNETRSQQEQPLKQQKLQGEAQQAQAEGRYRAPKLQAEIDNTRSQIGERADRLGLDRDKFNLDFDAKLAELQGKGAVKLSAGMEKAQADAVGSAGIAQQASDDALALAQQFRDAGGGYGAGATLAEKWAGLTGGQDGLTQLRKRYIQIKNQAALSMLPPGPASDKDISTIQAGFLPETADSKEIADWLDSFSRVQKAVAQRDNAKADWISEVGNTGTTKRDIEVQGVQVPAGTSFNDFVRRGLQRKPEQPAQPTAGAPSAGTPRYLQPQTWNTGAAK